MPSRQGCVHFEKVLNVRASTQQQQQQQVRLMATVLVSESDEGKKTEPLLRDDSS